MLKDKHTVLEHILYIIRHCIIWASPLLILALQQLQATGRVDADALWGLALSLLIEILERQRRLK